MRRLVSVSQLKNTFLPSRKNLEMPAGASLRCFSQKPYGSFTMSTMPPTSGTNSPGGDGRLRHVSLKDSCSSTTYTSAAASSNPAHCALLSEGSWPRTSMVPGRGARCGPGRPRAPAVVPMARSRLKGFSRARLASQQKR
jgi:hypothetical protein